jgi:hypothetical protein
VSNRKAFASKKEFCDIGLNIQFENKSTVDPCSYVRSANLRAKNNVGDQ